MDSDILDPSGNAGKSPPLLEGGPEEEGLNVVGLISIIVFYIAVLLVGVWAGWRQRKIVKNEGRTQDQEEVMLAGRNIGLFVGILTMGGNIEMRPTDSILFFWSFRVIFLFFNIQFVSIIMP